MPVVLYPIVVIIVGIIFYIFSKKNDPEPAAIPKKKEILPPTLPYKDENQQDFTWRCYNFIVDRFNRAGFRYHVSNNNSFLISYEREDGSLVHHNMIAYSITEIALFFSITGLPIGQCQIINLPMLLNWLIA